MSGAGAEESAECGCAAARLLPAPEPDLLYDHHSSEEELEVYNAPFTKIMHVVPGNITFSLILVLASLIIGLVLE